MGVIQKQGIQNTIITYIGIFIGFVNVIFIQPHFLTTEELGLVRILYSFSAIVAMLIPLGMSSITLRYFPHFRDRENRHHGFFGVLLVFIFIGLLIVGGMIFILKGWIMSLYVKESPLFVEFFYCVLPLCFLVAFNSLLSAYCQSLFKSSFPSLVNDVISRIFFIIIISLYYIHILTFTQFIYAFVGSYGILILIMFTYIFLIDRLGLKINIHKFKEQNIRKMLVYGLILSITSFASLGIKFVDSVMLGSYLPLSIVGIYSLAAFIPTIIEAPIGSLEKITGPKISDEWSRNNVIEIGKIYSESTKYLMIFGGLLLLGVTINIRSLMTLLPLDFSKGINVVYILSISTFFNMLTGVNGSILSYSKYYNYSSIMLIAVLGLTVISNMIFIPLYGMVGAAIGTALASLIFNVLKYFFIWYKMKMQPFNKISVYSILLIGICFFINYFIPVLKNPILDIVLRSVIISGIYIAVVYKMNVIPELNKFATRVGVKF